MSDAVGFCRAPYVIIRRHYTVVVTIVIFLFYVAIICGVSAPMTKYQTAGVITKTGEEFLSESLEYITFGD